eukprot:1350829-Pyramimonas_sp.AAC.1
MRGKQPAPQQPPVGPPPGLAQAAAIGGAENRRYRGKQPPRAEPQGHGHGPPQQDPQPKAPPNRGRRLARATAKPRARKQ